MLKWGHRLLTDVACRKAKAADKPYKLGDAQGLYLYVMPTGSRSWRWKYRFAGKEKRLVFGRYPEMTLTEARDARTEAARLLRSGVDPSIDRRQRTAAQAARSGATFELVAREWHESQGRVWSPRYSALVLRSLEQDVLPRIGKLPIAEITTPMVLEVLRPIEARGAGETAHRVRQRISGVFARAIASGITQADPSAIAVKALAAVSKGKFPAVRTIEAARDVLQRTEAQRQHPTSRLASRLLALTAVRSGVLRLATPAEFEDLDGSKPQWRIPASKMKLVRERKNDPSFEFIVPLSDQAVDVVKVALEFVGKKAPLIFPSPRDILVPISDSTLSKSYREAGFAGVHVPHGWRSAFSTVMNEIAAEENRVGDRAIVDLMLAHVPAGVEAAYNRAAYMPRRRELAQEWADLLMHGQPPASALLTGPRSS